MTLLWVRQGQSGQVGQVRAIALCDCCAALNPALQLGQLHVQHSCLNRIEAAVVSQRRVQVALRHTVHRQLPHDLCEGIVVAGGCTAIPSRTKILGGEKAEAAHITKTAHGLAVPLGSGGLGTVLNHLEVVAFGDGHQSAHVHRPAEQMHRHQGLRRRGDRRFDLIDIDQVRGRVHIHEHRRGTDGADGFSRGKKTEGAGDHFIPGTNAQGSQSKDQGIGATVAAHCMAAVHACGKGVFKLLDLRSADVLTAAQHVQHRLFEVLAQIADLLAEAEGGHLHKQKLKRISRTNPVPVRGSISRCSPPKDVALDSRPGQRALHRGLRADQRR